ncbi:DNA translocase FtsK 4TM domain-containing protein [Candidatus Saccharibacteria bacterium]|nr:DNA translocase FtsK 4TM domain-containing protein [Candidatus Saccharibacteria bacterium]
MAKKRGRRKSSKEVARKHELPGGFWYQVAALLMIVFAVILFVTWFGKGGTALNLLQDFLRYIFGNTTFLLPIILTYLAVMIFRAPDNRLDPSVWIASGLMLFWFSGIFAVPDYTSPDSSGGIIGSALDRILVGLCGAGITIFIYVVAIVVTALFMYAETPASFFKKLRDFFKSSRSREDSDNAQVMRRNGAEKPANLKADMQNFEVHSNVEIVDSSRRSVKPAAKPEPTTAKPIETALVAVNDPNWKMPSLDLLNKKKSPADPGDTHNNALIIKNTLGQFGINVDVGAANVGPRITQYTLRPPAGVKVAKIAQYDKDLALNLAKDKIRIEAPIPGTNQVGIEIPNDKAASVGLHELLKDPEWTRVANEKPLAFTLGKDIAGQTVVGNLAKMPHLLIAGTTGSGKSVMTNTLIASLLFHNSPSDLKLIIVDPKQVEMAAYEDIPHLLAPIITAVDKALSALKWAVNEMERRYSLMAKERVKNIVDYNEKIRKTGEQVVINDEDGNPQRHDGGKMPYIVVVVDEMADLMMMAGKELEMLIVRIAQKGRASGIHLVLATQRPEVKVVTGLIKANIPGRIAFAVNNGIDSRVMLDMTGAEKLLGSGDMLYLTTEMMGKPKRVQGAFVGDDEIARLTDFLREQAPPNYNDEVLSQQVSIGGKNPVMGEDISASGDGSLERQAAEIAVQARKISTSLLQRKLHIGYGRASSIIDHLEEIGVVSEPTGGNRPRDVLISSMDEYPE